MVTAQVLPADLSHNCCQPVLLLVVAAAGRVLELLVLRRLQALRSQPLLAARCWCWFLCWCTLLLLV
jgi:hypothetical protein